jgi:aspartate/methionine/tyrosine aminotransferase
MSDEQPPIAGFRSVPRTGVIYVTTEAVKRGFSPTDAEWCNLGQGQPETGELPGAPPRVHDLRIAVDDQEYAPVAGIGELRAAVAELYNKLYRQGQKSQYTAENVCVCGGGRSALTRAAASLGHINLGHFLPDYTAYEELLDIFKAFTAIPILLEGDRGEELQRWVAAARELDCTLLLDEFYSHYVYRGRPGLLPVASAARYVEDVDRDPVLIFDGLTKNWRYPGWRVTWAVGPRKVIDALASAGSFLDGGGSKPLQRAAVPLLELDHVVKETRAIQELFRKKRDRMLSELERIGVRFDRVPDGTFYCWGNVSALPPPFNDGMGFFRAALEQKVIVVPGEFFDVNPGKRRRGHGSRFSSYVRFSFGPPAETVERGLARIASLVGAPAK